MKDEKVARYRVSLELRNDKADSNDIKNYHKHLELPINEEAKLIYVTGNDKWGRPNRVRDTQEEIITKVKNKEYGKVQIYRYVERTEYTTNEEIQEDIFEAIEALLPYYEYVLGVKKDTYWPSLEEYNTGITSEKRIELLLEPKIASENIR